jgi:hypothetical protein
MTYDSFYAGIGGALLGALISTWLAYRFQRIIHKEQLEAQKKSQDAFLASLNRFQDILATSGNSLRQQLHTEGQAIKEAIQNPKRDAHDDEKSND